MKGAITLESYYNEIAKGLNEVSWKILGHIQRYEDISFKNVKETFKLSHGKAEKEIARLEGAVLIQTVRNSEDMRFLQYIPTEHGMEVWKLRKPSK